QKSQHAATRGTLVPVPRGRRDQLVIVPDGVNRQALPLAIVPPPVGQPSHSTKRHTAGKPIPGFLVGNQVVEAIETLKVHLGNLKRGESSAQNLPKDSSRAAKCKPV